jgi:hypothetical protein
MSLSKRENEELEAINKLLREIANGEPINPNIPIPGIPDDYLKQHKRKKELEDKLLKQ